MIKNDYYVKGNRLFSRFWTGWEWKGEKYQMYWTFLFHSTLDSTSNTENWAVQAPRFHQTSMKNMLHSLTRCSLNLTGKWKIHIQTTIFAAICFIHIGRSILWKERGIDLAVFFSVHSLSFICATKKVHVRFPTMSINHVSLFNQQRIFATEKLLIQTAMEQATIRQIDKTKFTYVMDGNSQTTDPDTNSIQFDDRYPWMRAQPYTFRVRGSQGDEERRTASVKAKQRPNAQNFISQRIKWNSTNRKSNQTYKWKNHWLNPLITISKL